MGKYEDKKKAFPQHEDEEKDLLKADNASQLKVVSHL